MIEVKDLTFSYGKDKKALHGLNFTVKDGEIFGFLGPNGSGKSTTQKILTGILKGYAALRKFWRNWNLSQTFLKSRFRPTQRVCGRGQAWRGH